MNVHIESIYEFQKNFPLDKSHLGQDLEVFLLGMKGGGNDLKPVVWLTAREIPFREVK